MNILNEGRYGLFEDFAIMGRDWAVVGEGKAGNTERAFGLFALAELRVSVKLCSLSKGKSQAEDDLPCPPMLKMVKGPQHIDFCVAGLNCSCSRFII